MPRQEESHLDKSRPVAVKAKSWPTFEEKGKTVKLKVSLQHSRQKKNDCFSVDRFCSQGNTVLKAIEHFYIFCPCQKKLLSITENDTERGNKKKEFDELRRNYLQEKSFIVMEMWDCET